MLRTKMLFQIQLLWNLLQPLNECMYGPIDGRPWLNMSHLGAVIFFIFHCTYFIYLARRRVALQLQNWFSRGSPMK